MEKHLSQTDLSVLYSSEVKKHGKKNISRIIHDQLKNSSPQANSSIFLCHSHLDKTIVNKMALLFEKLNIELYVDWMDNSMPVNTNKQTATLVKDKIVKCDKFLFLATYHALRSKWCNWELGIAYAIKGEMDFAILPIESKSGKWAGNEYLNLYPEMKLESGIELSDVGNIYIHTTGDRKISFKDWMRNNREH